MPIAFAFAVAITEIENSSALLKIYTICVYAINTTHLIYFIYQLNFHLNRICAINKTNASASPAMWWNIAACLISAKSFDSPLLFSPPIPFYIWLLLLLFFFYTHTHTAGNFLQSVDKQRVRGGGTEGGGRQVYSVWGCVLSASDDWFCLMRHFAWEIRLAGFWFDFLLAINLTWSAIIAGRSVVTLWF